MAGQGAKQPYVSVPMQAGSGGVPPAELPAPPGKPRNRRRRLILAIVAGVTALLVLGGVGVLVALYDDATKIEREAPAAVVDNFLGAYLVNRSDNEADLYSCKSGRDFTELSAYRAEIVNLERKYGVGISVSWGSFTVVINGNSGMATTVLTKTLSNGNERITKPWQFYMVDDDGWRVCGARQLSN